MDSFETSKEALLLQQNECLQAKIERIEVENEALGQGDRNKTEQESIPEKQILGRRKETSQHDDADKLVPLKDGGSTTEEHGQIHQQELQQQDIARILPTELIGRTLDYLPFSERRDFSTCGSKDLWNRVREEYEPRMMTDLSLDRPPTHEFLCRDFASVCTLNLGCHGSDSTLAILCHERAFPNLKHLAMAGSNDVTDNGLALIPSNPIRQNLQSIDITFCNRTTFAGTFPLRDRLVNLRTLRRQPKWMDGQITMPNGVRFVCLPDGVHTAYGITDGMLFCSYFRNVFNDDSSHRLVCKAQVLVSPIFTDGPFHTWPAWLQHASRPGVAYLHLPQDQAVLLAEAARGTLPVQHFPRPEDADLIPVNSSCQFNRQGNVCTRDDPNNYVFMSHRRMQPLDSLLPRQDVMKLCRDQVEHEKWATTGRNQEMDERFAHILNGGHPNDVPPEYWFQHYNE